MWDSMVKANLVDHKVEDIHRLIHWSAEMGLYAYGKQKQIRRMSGCIEVFKICLALAERFTGDNDTVDHHGMLVTGIDMMVMWSLFNLVQTSNRRYKRSRFKSKTSSSPVHSQLSMPDGSFSSWYGNRSMSSGVVSVEVN